MFQPKPAQHLNFLTLERALDAINPEALPYRLQDAVERRAVRWVSARSLQLDLHLRLVEVNGALCEGCDKAGHRSCTKTKPN